MKKIRFFVTQNNGDEYVVVKGALPKSIKHQFKVLCVQNDLEMSSVLEELIEKWVQADGPVYHSSIDLSDKNSEDVKAYVPKSLKRHFKTLCTLKQVKMRSVLCGLIHEWVKVQSKEVSSVGQ